VEDLKFGFAKKYRPSPNGEGRENEVKPNSERKAQVCDATEVEENY